MGDDVKVDVCKLLGVPFETPDDFNYRKAGKVDSLGVIRLVLTLEQRYQITISDADIVADGFCTIGGVVQTVLGKGPKIVF